MKITKKIVYSFFKIEVFFLAVGVKSSSSLVSRVDMSSEMESGVQFIDFWLLISSISESFGSIR